MLIRQLVIAALALIICSQHSTVFPSAVRPLRISVANNRTSSNNRSHVKGVRTESVSGLLAGRQATGDAKKNGSDFESEVVVEVEESSALGEEREHVTPTLLVPATRWAPPRVGYRGASDLQDSVQTDDSDQRHPIRHGNTFPFSSSSDTAKLTIRTPSSEVLGSDEGGSPRTKSLDPEFEEFLSTNRFRPLVLMGDPEPSDTIVECSYEKTQSAVVQMFVDAFDDDGCASCELDDEGQPIRDYPEDFSPQFLPADMDPRTTAERLRELFQAGLLDKDTFSAEDRRRASLRLTNPPSTNCTCSVGDQETMCSSGGAGRFCDQLPYTTVPSGILEVSHTNISELSVGSLAFVANVSVLRLAWNEVGRVEPDAFSNMSLLTNLSLAHNRLQALDWNALSGATEIREIVLAYNMFTDLTLATRALSAQMTPKLAHLNIGGNNFSAIGPKDFAPMSEVPLEDLQLHENNIQHIDSETFLELKHLRRLRLRDNNLSLDEVVELVEKMNDTSLELIDLSKIGEYSISQLKPVLSAIASSSIISLMLNNYCFPTIFGFLRPISFPRLRELSMRSCGIKSIYPNAFNEFGALESLDLRDNPFTYVPSAVIIPTLVSLDLSRPALRRYTGNPKPSFSVSQYRFRDMVNLKYLDLSYNNITKIERGAFVGLENLTVLLLKDTELEYIANFSFSMLENLSELHLSGNYLSAQPFEHLWQGLTGLTVLFLDHCLINNSQLYLSEMPRTELLNLTGNSLRNLTSSTFHGLSSLDTVDLSDNSIESWDERIFSDSRALLRIYLRYNSITWISTAMAEDFLELSLRVLMLGYNPFHCSCHLHDWLDGQDETQDSAAVMADWILFKERNGGYITNDIDDCYCHSPEKFSNQSVLEFFQHSGLSPCAEPSVSANRTRMLLMMLPVFVSGMVAALAIRLVYKNRWYLRYWLFRLTSKRWLKRLRKDNEGFLYDAFVSYSSEDASFVSEMIEQLEKIPPFYRLCVYERDFEIGNVISECILESINTSRKSILILTDHFAKSHWCRWEMNLVQCRLFEQTRDDLIIVKLGKIRSRHLTPTIRYLMRTRIYIEWGPSAQQQLLFWERLRTALRKPGGTPELPRTV